MDFENGLDRFRYLAQNEIKYKSKDSVLNSLLGGGMLSSLTHLIIGDRSITSQIVNDLCFYILYQSNDPEKKVALIDGYNRFDLYGLSRLAASKGFNPTFVLERVLISRAFTWHQTVEILEKSVQSLSDISALLVSGVTSFFAYEKESFEQLLTIMEGIKKMRLDDKTLVLLTTDKNKKSLYRPKGGKIMEHFPNVVVQIRESDRFFEYHLLQHPFIEQKVIKKYKKIKPKFKHVKNKTLDDFL